MLYLENWAKQIFFKGPLLVFVYNYSIGAAIKIMQIMYQLHSERLCLDVDWFSVWAAPYSSVLSLLGTAWITLQ